MTTLLRRWGARLQRTVCLCALVTGSIVASESLSSGQSMAWATQSPSSASSNASPQAASRAASIARQTMSPFCPGRTLADCPSNFATEWREDIRAMVARGMSDDQIQAELSKRAGGDLSGIPHRNVSYALPVALVLGAIFILVFLFRRLRQQRKEHKTPSALLATSGAPAVDDERLLAELDAEEDEDAR